MTQLSRYIENMKLAIRGVRLVQFTPFCGGRKAVAEPIDTHLFLNGEAPAGNARQSAHGRGAHLLPARGQQDADRAEFGIVHNGRTIAREGGVTAKSNPAR